MSDPTLTLRLYGADREPLAERANVIIRDVAKQDTVYDGWFGRQTKIEGLKAGRRYSVQVFPDKHRGCGKFLRLTSKDATLAFYCPVRPEMVKGIDDHFDEELHGDDARRIAGMWNITSKMRSIRLPSSGETLDDYCGELERTEPDRIYFEAPEEFRELVRAATDGELFEAASGALHAPFDDNHVINGSVKTLDRYGNLQLTFHVGKERGGLIVEADIDEARGIGHLFQVLRNFLPGVETDPFDVHEILTFYQELDPGYELVT